MRTKNKKTFELSSIVKYKQEEHRLWLIPLACLLFSVMCPSGKKAFDDLIKNPGIATVVGMIILFGGETLVLSIIPFFIGKIIIRTKIITTIQNCTITNMQDFDYYRDKLTGLSPAVISILTDLDIEQKKDVAASVLQYENLGLLKEDENHTYHATDKYYSCKDLNDSDRYLIEHLEKGDFDWENDTRWKQLVIDEAISEGYIARKITQKNQEKKEGSPKGCLVPIVVVLVWFLWVGSALPRMMELTAVLDTAPENASLAEQVAFLSQHNLFPACIEVILMFIYLMFMVAFVLSASRVGSIIIKNKKLIKRTDYGTQMAECIYGMKNFIHDFSNLNAADRRQVVLWEDYLVYAVVLEENEEIVKEISKTRREVVC